MAHGCLCYQTLAGVTCLNAAAWDRKSMRLGSRVCKTEEEDLAGTVRYAGQIRYRLF